MKRQKRNNQILKRKRQVMLYPPVSLITALDQAIKTLRIETRTRNSLIVEIAETYLPHWVASEQAKRSMAAFETPADVATRAA